MPLQFGHIELFVNDPVAASRFYANTLGFEIVAVQGDFVWIKSGHHEILLRPRTDSSAASEAYAHSRTAFVFYTDDLDETLRAFKGRGLFPQGKDGSQKCPLFVDPDGNWFQVVNPADHN